MTDATEGDLPPGWNPRWKRPEETKRAKRERAKRERLEASRDVFVEGVVIPPRPPTNQWNRKYVFDEAMKAQIVERIASGETLKKIVSDENMPSYMTVYREERRDEEFGEAMRLAREVAAAVLADEVIEISDNATEDYRSDGGINYEVIARSKLRTDNRKWLISKLDPKRWGDKVHADITSGGEKIESKEISPMESARQVAFALELAKRANEESSQ